jgi:hypothetical protein
VGDSKQRAVDWAQRPAHRALQPLVRFMGCRARVPGAAIGHGVTVAQQLPLRVCGCLPPTAAQRAVRSGAAAGAAMPDNTPLLLSVWAEHGLTGPAVALGPQPPATTTMLRICHSVTR